MSKDEIENILKRAKEVKIEQDHNELCIRLQNEWLSKNKIKKLPDSFGLEPRMHIRKGII